MRLNSCIASEKPPQLCDAGPIDDLHWTRLRLDRLSLLSRYEFIQVDTKQGWSVTMMCMSSNHQSFSYMQGYGKAPVGEIPANSTLSVDVELLSIKTNPFKSNAVEAS